MNYSKREPAIRKNRRPEIIKLFGVSFLNGSYSDAINNLTKGGLMVAPAAPALASIERDQQYFDSLRNSSFAIFDSGLFAVLLRIATGKKISRVSGLEFLDKFLSEPFLHESEDLFSIDPTMGESMKNRDYFLKRKVRIDPFHHYVAPVYDRQNVEDHKLLSILEKIQPKFILINLGGGVQERLGHFLKNNLHYGPSIICTGAAISFLTGAQAKIPKIIDRLYLGWLMRCISNPKIYVRRYLDGLALIPLVLKNRKDIECKPL